MLGGASWNSCMFGGLFFDHVFFMETENKFIKIANLLLSQDL